jgi:hypothetical protein
MKEHKHDFQKLINVARKYYKETNCCTVIAVAVAANIGFGKAYHAMKREGRKDRRGAYFTQYKAALVKLGYKVERRDMYMGKTLATAKRLCPKQGTFLINTRSHVTCIRDGVMVDWAADNNSRKRIIGIHEVIKN